MQKATSSHSTPFAVCALLRRSDGRYLLIRRADSLPGGGHWCPITGRPETGEAHAEAVAREVLEEVGLHVQVKQEIFRCPTSDGRFTLCWHPCEPVSSDDAYAPLTLEAREVSEARWLTAREASSQEPTFEATAAFFKRLSLAE